MRLSTETYTRARIEKHEFCVDEAVAVRRGKLSAHIVCPRLVFDV